MPKDVKQGDLVRIFLESSNYVGYRWRIDGVHIGEQMICADDTDIIFSSIDPYGITKVRSSYFPKNLKKDKAGQPIIESIQFVGVNLVNKRLGNESIRGYQVLERARYKEMF